MRSRAIISPIPKLSLFILDFSIFMTELGAFLTWLATITHFGGGSTSAQILAAFWIANRTQRILFGSLIGSFVDSSKNKVNLLANSIIFYILVLGCFLVFDKTDSIIPLLIISFVLPIFRQCASLARIVYVKNLFEGDDLKNQVKLFEILPLAASGVSALTILYFSSTLSLKNFIVLDVILHLIVLLALKVGTWPKIPNAIEGPIKHLDFKKEWTDLKGILNFKKLRNETIELYLLILAFGSYPILVNIVSSGERTDTNSVYAAYAIGLAAGSFAALVINHLRKAQIPFFILRALTVGAAFLQLIGVVNFGLSHNTHLFATGFIGFIVTMIFVLYMATLRANIVAHIEVSKVASWLSIIARFEFLTGALMAFAIGQLATSMPLIYIASIMIVIVAIKLGFIYSKPGR